MIETWAIWGIMVMAPTIFVLCRLCVRVKELEKWLDSEKPPVQEEVTMSDAKIEDRVQWAIRSRIYAPDFTEMLVEHLNKLQLRRPE
jgi:hypothetical protein